MIWGGCGGGGRGREEDVNSGTFLILMLFRFFAVQSKLLVSTCSLICEQLSDTQVD